MDGLTPQRGDVDGNVDIDDDDVDDDGNVDIDDVDVVVDNVVVDSDGGDGGDSGDGDGAVGDRERQICVCRCGDVEMKRMIMVKIKLKIKLIIKIYRGYDSRDLPLSAVFDAAFTFSASSLARAVFIVSFTAF